MHERAQRFLAIVAISLGLMLAAGCTASSPEIGNSGVTEQEFEDAVRAYEESLSEVDERLIDSSDGVQIQVTICEIIDIEREPGPRRRTWVRVTNENATPVTVTVELGFADGGTAGDSYEVEAAEGDEPGSSIFAFNEAAETDSPAVGKECTGDIDSTTLVDAIPSS